MSQKKLLHNEKTNYTVLQLKVVTTAGMQKAVSDKSGMVKIYLKSAPEKGKANQELVEFLAKMLEIPQTAITIITGATSRIKTVKIATHLTNEQLLNKLM